MAAATEARKIWNSATSLGLDISLDGRRPLRTRPVELPREYQDLTVEVDGVKISMVRSYYRGPYHSFYIQERASTFAKNRAKVFLGDEGGFVIRGEEQIHELVFGEGPTKRNDSDAARLVVDARVKHATINNGAFWVGEEGSVEDMLIAGPAEIFTPDGEIDKYIGQRRIEGEGRNATINGTWVMQGPIKYRPAAAMREEPIIVEHVEEEVVDDSRQETGERVVTEFEEVGAVVDGQRVIVWSPKDNSALQIARPEGAPLPVVLEREGGFVIELQPEGNFPMIRANGTTVTIRDIDNPSHKTGALNDNIHFDLPDGTAHTNTLVRPEVAITNGRALVEGRKTIKEHGRTREEGPRIIIDHAETVAAEGYRRGDTLQTAAIVIHEKTLIKQLLLNGLANVTGPMNVDPRQYVRDMKLVGSNSWNGAIQRKEWSPQENAPVEPLSFFPFAGKIDGERPRLPRIVDDVTGDDGSRTVTFEPGLLGLLSIPEGTTVIAPELAVQDVHISGGQATLKQIINGGRVEGFLAVGLVSGTLTVGGAEKQASASIDNLQENSVVTVSNGSVEITGENKGIVKVGSDSSLILPKDGRFTVLPGAINITINGEEIGLPPEDYIFVNGHVFRVAEYYGFDSWLE